MFINPTKEILQQIKDSGVPIIKLSMDEFQKIASEGKILTNEEVKQKLKNYGNTSNRIV
jgi:2-iminoacetate synthase ThiH